MEIDIVGALAFVVFSIGVNVGVQLGGKVFGGFAHDVC